MIQLVKEKEYEHLMKNEVEPYLAAHGGERQAQREPGKTISYVRYLAEQPAGVVMISHGFTESAEKYKEICYYFLREGYHVYMPEHCGHGKSYRLTDDLSLVHIDSFQRYVDDFLFMTRLAKEEQPELPVYLFGHSMGGGIAAAAAAQLPGGYKKVILSSPMIRPLTYGVPYRVSQIVATVACMFGKQGNYVVGTHPYEQPEKFEDSASLSRARFSYYLKKQYAEPLYHTCAPSYSWAREAIRLNKYLRSRAYKLIESPVLLFQAGRDAYVNNDEQTRFVDKINGFGKTKAKLVRFDQAKHEIFNAEDATVQKYWDTIFKFLGSKN